MTYGKVVKPGSYVDLAVQAVKKKSKSVAQSATKFVRERTDPVEIAKRERVDQLLSGFIDPTDEMISEVEQNVQKGFLSDGAIKKATSHTERMTILDRRLEKVIAKHELFMNPRPEHIPRKKSLPQTTSRRNFPRS